MAQETEFASIGQMEPDRQAELAGLETKTDRVFHLRRQLVTFYRENRGYLGTTPTEGADPQTSALPEKRFRLADIYAGSQEGKPIQAFLDLPKVRADGEIKSKDIHDPRMQKVAAEMYTEEVVMEYQHALQTYAELVTIGGQWDEANQTQESEAVERYYRMRFGEKQRFVTQAQELQAREIELTDKIQLQQLRGGPRTDAQYESLQQWQTELQAIGEQREELQYTIPEGFLYLHSQKMAEIKGIFDKDGTIIETPYVTQTIARISQLVKTGRPVFLHGELGTGKTELAKHMARTRLSLPHLLRWEAVNPQPAAPAKDANEAEKIKYQGDLTNWQAKRDQEQEALVISGYRNLEVKDALGVRSVQQAEMLSPEEQTKAILEGWERQKSLLADETGEVPTEENLAEQKRLYMEQYQEALKSPVEIVTVLGPLLRAMKEGRPLIIDEMNAIPHHVLIAFNDLLLRKPGDMITPFIPGAEPFEVQTGFSVIATGNYKPEDGIMYVGRQPLDAAFLSRFGLVNYDYLPMQRLLEPDGLTPEESREFRQENELFQMLVIRLLDPDLTVRMPKDSLGKLQRLSLVARHIQDVFAGREVDSAWFADKNGTRMHPKDVLKENVLSLRHLLPLLDKWKREGFSRDLDDYIFLDYVAKSDARPEEKKYIYKLLQIQGSFFPSEQTTVDARSFAINSVIPREITLTEKNTPKTASSDFWPSYADPDTSAITNLTAEHMSQEMYGSGKQVIANRSVGLERFTTKEIVEALYGPTPVRQVLPQSYLDGGNGPSAEDVSEEQLETLRIIARMEQQVADLQKEGFLIEKTNDTPPRRGGPRG